MAQFELSYRINCIKVLFVNKYNVARLYTHPRLHNENNAATNLNSAVEAGFTFIYYSHLVKIWKV